MDKFRSKLISSVAGLSMLTLGGGFAAAADFAPPPVFDWTGMYVGAHAGYGEANLQGDWCPSECEFPMSALDLNGGIGGLQVGYNWQMDSIIFGVEGDVSFPAWSGTLQNCEVNGGSCTSAGFANIDVLASIRGRLGFATSERSMLYATGGVAFVDGDFEGQCEDFCGRVGLSAVGGVVGGGFEYSPVDNISIRGEGLYYIFDDKKSIEDFDKSSPGDSTGIKDAFVIRVGLNWLIN